MGKAGTIKLDNMLRGESSGVNEARLANMQLAVNGEVVPFDASEIGNARYVIDDDGDLKDCKEMIKANGATFVLEQDKDGDVDLTILDPTAAYINN